MSENKKSPGQPTKYKPEYIQELIKYFSIEPYKEVTKKIRTKTGEVVEVEEKEPADIPSLAGFAIKLGVHRETLLNWCDEDPEFFDAYKLAKEYQENYLLVNGVKDLIPTNFAQFLLINHAKYRIKSVDEAPETTITQNFNQLSEEELYKQGAEAMGISVEEFKKHFEGKK